MSNTINNQRHNLTPNSQPQSPQADLAHLLVNNGDLTFQLNQALKVMHESHRGSDLIKGGRTLTQPSSLAICPMNIQESSRASLRPKNFRNTINAKKSNTSKISLKVDKRAKS